MMADAKHLLDFLEGGVGMFFDVRLKFFGVELAPFSPAGFRGERAGLAGFQIPVNGTPPHVKAPGGLGFGAAGLDEFHHPFPQVQRVSFHARKSVTICPNVNMNCYTCKSRRASTPNGPPTRPTAPRSTWRSSKAWKTPCTTATFTAITNSSGLTRWTRCCPRSNAASFQRWTTRPT